MGLPSVVPFATLELLPDPAGRADGETYMGGTLTVVRGVVFHVNAGNGDPRNWWTSPDNHGVASAHIQIMKSGEIRQLVPLNRVAWAECDGNGEWHSVETEGFPSEPLTDAQFEAFARLLAWGHVACGWPLQVTDSPTGVGLGTHQMGGAAWGGHACPGPIRAGQRPALLARAQQLLTSPTGDDMPLTPADVTMLYWGTAFRGTQNFAQVIDEIQDTANSTAAQVQALAAAVNALAGAVAKIQASPAQVDATAIVSAIGAKLTAP